VGKKNKKDFPWYVVSLMLTILGAISIVMLFVVYYYNERGIVFWSIIISWFVILMAALLEIGRLEKQQRTLREQKDLRIAELEKALAEKE
jgi:O-antigen/teichoic acid export membrane protein